MRSATATSCLKLNTKKLVSQLETSLKPSSVSPGGGSELKAGGFRLFLPPTASFVPVSAGMFGPLWLLLLLWNKTWNVAGSDRSQILRGCF